MAQELKIEILDESVKDKELKIGSAPLIHYLTPEQSIDIQIPIEAGFNIRSAEHKIKINVLEHFSYDMDPAYLVMNTLKYQAPEIAFSGYEVVDYGEGTAAIQQDGQIQAGEQVKLKVYIQNVGQNRAENIRYKVYSGDRNLFIDGGSGSFDQMDIGEVKNFWVTVSPNKRIDESKNLPIYMDVTVDKNLGNLTAENLEIALNQQPPEAQTLAVKADMAKLQKQVARFEYTSNKFTANIGKTVNIRQVPVANTRMDNAVAVVFGIENYDDLPPAPYAENDAKIIEEYFKNMLGIEKVVTYNSAQSRGLIFDDVFNPDYGELQKAVVRGETDLFVFYSGHGIPSKTGDQVYLFPSDGKVARLELQGYDLSKFYENLEKLGAKSVTVFLDACFSGASRTSEKLETENLVAMKGIRVKPKLRQPWKNQPDFSVITSSSMEETSLALDASQTGLFTYYICAGLKGEADLNANKEITFGELYQYVKKEVMNTSKKISGLQTPEFHGNADKVLVTF
ncbi:MAG: caspase family protein [Bacteroidales bacterium]|nr:caspase family protein [Bacteroidales bacterium]